VRPWSFAPLAPLGLIGLPAFTHGFRRGLHFYAASRPVDSQIRSHCQSKFCFSPHTPEAAPLQGIAYVPELTWRGHCMACQ